jgi:hypothetical protein
MDAHAASRSRAATPVLLVLLCGALGLAGWFLLAHGKNAKAAPAAKQTNAQPGQQATPPAVRGQGPALAPRQQQEAKQIMLHLPDGSSVPALNHITMPVEFAWPQGVPYAPIVGRETDFNGTEWYVHADGTRSTTEMKYRKDLGREDATAITKNPLPVAPIPESERPHR